MDSAQIEEVSVDYSSFGNQSKNYTVSIKDSVFKSNVILKSLIDSVLILAKKTVYFASEKTIQVDSVKKYNVFLMLDTKENTCIISPYKRSIDFNGRKRQSFFSIGHNMDIGEYAHAKYYSDSLLSMKVIDLANEIIKHENNTHINDNDFKKKELLSYSNPMYILK